MGRSLLLRSVPFPVVLALRYLRSTRRDAFASFLSAVAAGGLGLGVAALIVPLAGTYRSGRTQEERERVALPRSVAETLLGGADRRLEVVAADLDAALGVAGRLPAVLPRGSVVRTWKDLNRPLLFALRLEKAVMFVAVSLIVLVAALALIADLALIIASKRPEIGTLSTLGATPADLRRAFLLLGGLVAGSGMLAGAVLGVGGAWVLDRNHLVPVPGRVYFLA